jgi:hypothetical protein
MYIAITGEEALWRAMDGPRSSRASGRFLKLQAQIGAVKLLILDQNNNDDTGGLGNNIVDQLRHFQQDLAFLTYTCKVRVTESCYNDFTHWFGGRRPAARRIRRSIAADQGLFVNACGVVAAWRQPLPLKRRLSERSLKHCQFEPSLGC